MFKKVLKSLVEFFKNSKEPSLRVKRYQIKKAIIKFYEDLDKTVGGINIPAFIRAEKTMQEIVRSPKDIEEYYQKLLKYGWLSRIQ